MTHTKTNIVQYNEYYPFGLQASTSWTREHSTNNFLYNSGAELNTTSGLYDTFYRGFDPALGRFMQVDPLAHEYHSVTPYQYALNNPALNNPALLNDPNGDKVSQFSPVRNAYLSRYAASWHQTTSNDGSMAHDLADAFYDANTFEGGGSSAPSEGDFFKTTLIATENATGFTYVMQVYHTSDEIIEVFASSVYESMGGYVAHYGNEYSWSGAELSGVMSAAQTQGRPLTYVIGGADLNFSGLSPTSQAIMNATGGRGYNLMGGESAMTTQKVISDIKRAYTKGQAIQIYGYSLGGKVALDVASALEAANIPIALLVTVDAAEGPMSALVHRNVSSNVLVNFNFFQTTPSNIFSRGDYNTGTGLIFNYNLTGPTITHGNIDEATMNIAIRLLTH